MMTPLVSPLATWAAACRQAPAPGDPPPLETIQVPDVRGELAIISALLDKGDETTSMAWTLLWEFDQASLTSWAADRLGSPDPVHARKVEEGMAALLEGMEQALFDGCIAIAEEEVAAWDKNLIRRDRHLWQASRYWAILAARRSQVAVGSVRGILAAVQRGKAPLIFPVFPEWRAAAAACDAASSILPTLITCLQANATWKVVLRLPARPGGTVRLRAAQEDEQPLAIPFLTCCGSDVALDTNGCAPLPWNVLAEAWNHGGVWVSFMKDGFTAFSDIVEIT